MNDRLNEITESIADIDYVEITSPFVANRDVIDGSIKITVDEVELNFNVKIFPQYPLQFREQETIKFFNLDLLQYDHVNADGSICVHTLHSPDLPRKIQFDFNSLLYWVRRYYIGKEKDENYEHIIVPQASFKETHRAYLFTEVSHNFVKGEFGQFTYSFISNGNFMGEKIITYIVQKFILKKQSFRCTWSNHYNNLATNEGIFYFLESAPVANRRFAFKNWTQLEPLISQEFFRFLKTYQRKFVASRDGEVLPLMIGYKMSSAEIHWQTILIPVDNFPNYGQQVLGGSNWIGRFHDQNIIWAQTKNCSYKYFFGRGVLHENLTASKILVIGIGAIGSQVAMTLIRGGCKNIVLFDYDIKEPENVCRSEYLFSGGITKKVDEMGAILFTISPFVDITISEKFMDFAKYIANDNNLSSVIQEGFNEYDIIFDCTGDNDVAYILDQCDIKGSLFNLSVTNRAKELVCAVNPNSYKWVIEIFQNFHSNTDLYQPTGCWSPTFRASYNDISAMVQYALKHINECFSREISVRNFYLTSSFDNCFTIKLNQF